MSDGLPQTTMDELGKRVAVLERRLAVLVGALYAEPALLIDYRQIAAAATPPAVKE